MRTIVSLVLSAAMGLLLPLVSRALAQQQSGSMMPDCMSMMGWPMMVFMGLFWVLLVVLMVLASLWLIKQLRK